MIKRLLYTLLFVTISNTVLFAQDVQYSQFYASPIYLNPAFAGANACSRLSTNYRVQWPGVPGKFSSFILSYDHSLPSKNSAFGLLFTKDQAGSGKLGSTSASGIYAYQLHLTRKWTINTGFQGTFTSRSVNFYDLYFVDQLLTGSNTTVESPLSQKTNYFDVSTGMVAYSKSFWFGFSAKHLTTPNQGLVQEKGPLPVRTSFHTGKKFAIGNGSDARRNIEKTNITAALNYERQKDFRQLSLGFYYQYEPVVLGLWYRGLPMFKTVDNQINNDAIVLLAGFTMSRFNFGYSYDITLSKLGAGAQGSHEVSLSYQFCDPSSAKKRKKVQKFFACPKF